MPVPPAGRGGGTVWLKAIPPFAAAEPAAIAAFAEVDPGLVPAVLASAPGRLLLGDVPGTERRDPPPQVVADTVRRFVAAQARRQPSRRPVSRTAARRSWRRPSVTCSTARSAPS